MSKLEGGLLSAAYYNACNVGGGTHMVVVVKWIPSGDGGFERREAGHAVSVGEEPLSLRVFQDAVGGLEVVGVYALAELTEDDRVPGRVNFDQKVRDARLELDDRTFVAGAAEGLDLVGQNA